MRCFQTLYSQCRQGEKRKVDEIDTANERADLMNRMAIQATLNRLSREPSKGICRACGEAIEAARLHANPSAPTCYDCAAEEEAERQRRRKVGGRG